MIRFFFSETNLLFIDILDRFCHNLFTFLFFDFWYSTSFLYSTKFIQCSYVFHEKPVKFSASKCCCYVLFFMKHSYLLKVKITPDVDNPSLLVFGFSSLAPKKFEQFKTYLGIRNSIKSNEIDFFECFRFQCYF